MVILRTSLRSFPLLYTSPIKFLPLATRHLFTYTRPQSFVIPRSHASTTPTPLPSYKSSPLFKSTEYEYTTEFDLNKPVQRQPYYQPIIVWTVSLSIMAFIIFTMGYSLWWHGEREKFLRAGKSTEAFEEHMDKIDWVARSINSRTTPLVLPEAPTDSRK